PASSAAIAELINIASGLDLAQVEPQIRKLQSQTFAAQEDVKRAITNYLALRTLSMAAEVPSRTTLHASKSASGLGNAKAKMAKARDSAKKRPATHRKAARR